MAEALGRGPTTTSSIRIAGCSCSQDAAAATWSSTRRNDWHSTPLATGRALVLTAGPRAPGCGRSPRSREGGGAGQRRAARAPRRRAGSPRTASATWSSTSITIRPPSPRSSATARDLGVRVRYSWEQPVLGSAGGPRHALPLLTDGGSQTFLIVNGDTLTDVDLAALLNRPTRRRGALVTMALIPNPRRTNTAACWSTDGYGARLHAAPAAAQQSFHFIGVQVAEAEAFAPSTTTCRRVGRLALSPACSRSNPRSIAAFVSTATFHDIGTPADCLRTSLELRRNRGRSCVSAERRGRPDRGRRAARVCGMM